MDDESVSRGSLLGLAGLASLCCVGPGAAALTGSAAAGGLLLGLSQALVIGLTLLTVGLVVRWRLGCSQCSS
ncbi:hypothetical protein [Natrarchaeobaculum aegyptiacum]|uniref:Uncharacterized protein n=1 Tax=Natrarchaeobaculum aegyptiacum TaxID=745377 RepID=A0A2Z2HU27_9EURY|nr:hypothetical protein [Natrarchaeobaculum aegyptiacum]ARS90720.1 hypothetical protein B1756_13925 [Natrarchaeobaculum aegyptiacum]